MARERFSPLAALQYNLKRLLLIRAIVLACQVTALVLALLVLDLALPYAILASVMAVSAALNAGLAEIRADGTLDALVQKWFVD